MKKKLLNGLILSCATFAIAGAVATTKTMDVSASNAQVTISEPTTFAALEGAQVRKTVDTSGIRFSTIVNDEWWATETAGKSVEYGYLVAKDVTEELTEENATKVPSQLLLEVDADGDTTTDYLRFNYAITNIPETEYETLVSARPYVTIDGNTQYGETQTRSIAEVAAKAFAAGESDPDNVVAGYVNAVAQDVNFEAATQKLNKAVISVETAGLAVATQPAGYAVKITSNNEDVAKIVDGKVVPQAKEGKATITAQFGTQKSATYELTVVSYSATLGGATIEDDSIVKVKVADGYFASVNAATQASDAKEKLVIKEYDGTSETDVTASAVYTYSVANVATVDQGTITGNTVNGTTTVVALVDGYEVANFDVEGWTEITTKKQMDELGLSTWRLRNKKAEAQAVLAGKYVLGNDIDYQKAYIIPIANAVNKYSSQSALYKYYYDDCVDTFLWRDVLSDESVTPADEWAAIKFGTKESTFRTSNPHDLPFTGTFDGNGYEIKNGKMFFANGFVRETPTGSEAYWKASGGCVFGENAGTIKNVAFTDLQYSDTYYGHSKISTETFAGHARADSWKEVGAYRFKDGLYNNAFCGFIYSNKGTISNVRVDAIAVDLSADYGKGNAYEDSRGAFGVRYNWSSGVIENLLINEKSTTFEVKDNTGANVSVQTGFSIAQYGVFGYNAGTVKNSVLVFNVGYGAKYGINNAKTAYYNQLHNRNNDCADVNCNAGTVDTAMLTVHINTINGTPDTNTKYRAMFSDSVWNKGSMTLKKGALWNI